jgi:hypothetical protein
MGYRKDREPGKCATQIGGHKAFHLFVFVRPENDEIAKFADVEAGIGFSRSGERRTAIANRALQHPMDRGFYMISGPYPIDFALS